jgi:hypothetical protein
LPDRFRIVEKFLLRNAPAVDFGEADDVVGPQRLDPTSRWTPNMGASELRRRFRAWSNRADWSDFNLGDTTPPKPLTPDEISQRNVFARRELGFEPSEVMEDQLGWRDFLRRQYPVMKNLNDAYESAFIDYTQVPLPSDQPDSEDELADWNLYVASTLSEPYGVKRALWQKFLARRYSGIGPLNSKHGTNWQSFDEISFPTSLPSQTAALWDWYQFESLVLPTLKAAHRFTVLLPFTGQTLPQMELRAQQLELARRLIELEKPAHTAFYVKFYWAR